MKRILHFLLPIKPYVVLASAFILLSQAMTLLLPFLMSMMINNGIVKGDIDYVKRIGAIMLAAAACGVVISVFNAYFSSKASTLYGKILRETIFLKVESLAQCDIEKIGTSSLVTRSTNDVRQLQDFILQSMRMILAAPIMLVGGTVMAFVLNARLASVIFLILPIIAAIAAIIIKLVMPLIKLRQKKTDRLNHLVREKFSGIRVIRAFNRSKYEDDRFNVSNGELADITLKVSRIFSVLIPSCIMLVFGAVSALIWIAAKNIDRMDILTEAVKIENTIGDLQAFIIYMIMIVGAMTMAGAMFVIVPRATISAKRILEVLDLNPQIVPPVNPLPVNPNKKGTVEFREVSFGYPGAQDTVLTNISFTAKPGQTTAIIGGTGCGKSTLINLIPRFYDATDGSIMFDGVDVKQLDEDDLHSRIGLIPQSATLFSGTIADNVRFGNENATDEDVWQALEIAQAADFVRALPDGIDSPVSQSGTNLSGGQKQRLAIARAIAKKAEVYIFDDSFSALDFKTDLALRSALRNQLSNSAIIIVAQRVGTIITADNIVVLDEGRIAGTGTHAELLGSCRVYREIAESQLSQEELA